MADVLSVATLLVSVAALLSVHAIRLAPRLQDDDSVFERLSGGRARGGNERAAPAGAA